MTLPGVPTVQRCTLGSLSEDVIADPVQENYHIGQTVTLSCPEGKQLDGVEEVSCNPSQEFSPDPANVRCLTGGLATSIVTPSCSNDALNALRFILSCINIGSHPTVAKPQVHPVVQCKAWEKSARGKCVCKMPFECRCC